MQGASRLHASHPGSRGRGERAAGQTRGPRRPDTGQGHRRPCWPPSPATAVQGCSLGVGCVGAPPSHCHPLSWRGTPGEGGCSCPPTRSRAPGWLHLQVLRRFRRIAEKEAEGPLPDPVQREHPPQTLNPAGAAAAAGACPCLQTRCPPRHCMSWLSPCLPLLRSVGSSWSSCETCHLLREDRLDCRPHHAPLGIPTASRSVFPAVLGGTIRWGGVLATPRAAAPAPVSPCVLTAGARAHPALTARPPGPPPGRGRACTQGQRSCPPLAGEEKGKRGRGESGQVKVSKD